MVCTIDDLLVEAVEGATFLHCRVDENGRYRRDDEWACAPIRVE